MRKLNRRLGQKADFLNVIPGDLVLPWMLSALAGYTLLQGILGLGWIWTVVLIGWSWLFWLLLAGRHPHRFFGQMLTPPRLGRARWRQEGR
jgi:hypothetical protein